MLPSWSIVCSNHQFVFISGHHFMSGLEIFDVTVVNIQHLLYLENYLLIGSWKVVATTIRFSIFIAHEVNLEELVFFMWQRKQRSSAMVNLSFDFKSRHITSLSHFSCRTEGCHLEATVVISAVVKEVF